MRLKIEKRVARREQRLRDAAPDLLAACEALLAAEGAVIGTEYGNDRLASAIEQARAAIAKARGV